MSSTERTRRSLLAGASAAAPLLLAAGNGLLPPGSYGFTGTPENALASLQATAAAPERVRAGSLCLVAGLVLLAVAFCGVASLARGRGGRAATAGVVLGIVGCTGGVLVAFLLGLSPYAAVAADVPQDARVAHLVALTDTSGLGMLAGPAYFGGLLGAAVAFGVALVLARAVPLWLALLFPVAVVMAALTAPQGLLGVLFSVPLLVAVPLLARDVARTAPSAAVPAQPAPVPA